MSVGDKYTVLFRGVGALLEAITREGEPDYALDIVIGFLELLRKTHELSEHDNQLIGDFLEAATGEKSSNRSLESLITDSDESPLAAIDAMMRLTRGMKTVVDGGQLSPYFKQLADQLINGMLNPPSSVE